jgi:hypothetical protein
MQRLGFPASLTSDHITAYDAKCAVDPERTSTAECLAIEFFSKYSARLHRRSPDRRSLGDGACLIAIPAVGSIECSGTCISRQLSDRAQGHAVSGTDRMQRAIWIDLPAAARTTIFPSIICATSEPVCRHPALVNVHAPSKPLLSSSGVARDISSSGRCSSLLGSERNDNLGPPDLASIWRDCASASDGSDAMINRAHPSAILSLT